MYIQLMDQVKHAVETGALRAGDQLPTIRKLAEDLVMNSNTVIRAYRELEHEGVVELRHGAGAFVTEAVIDRAKVMRKAQSIAQSAIERLDTRWRFVLILGVALATLLMGESGDGIQNLEHARALAGLQLFLSIFAAIQLAGAGIRTQSPFRAKAGLHGSTQYTLSMPVSRSRLLQ
jgi:DNA-binding transcriptional regulator YhcF (GntR family)